MHSREVSRAALDPANDNARTASLRALREGWPVLLEPFVGVAFGVLARGAGLDPLTATAMSALVFAGAAQFAMLDLVRSEALPVVVIATVLLINSRHLLMATALRPWFTPQPLLARLGLGFLLTDETFALSTSYYARGGHRLAYYLTGGLVLWSVWVGATLLGASAGAALPEPRQIGLDFAVTAAFIAIVVIGVRDRLDIAIALLAALVAGLLRASGFAVVAVLVAGAIAPVLRVARR